MNLFSYCNNNPVMYSDGSGHMPEWLNVGIVVCASILSVAVIAITCGAVTPILVGTAVGGVSSAAFSILGYASKSVGAQNKISLGSIKKC